MPVGALFSPSSDNQKCLQTLKNVQRHGNKEQIAVTRGEAGGGNWGKTGKGQVNEQV